MHIGTVRLEEARALDTREGYHPFHNEDGAPYGSFEVFWVEGSGWYWHACFPGYMPDGESCGPFASSIDAHFDADPNAYN